MGGIVGVFEGSRLDVRERGHMMDVRAFVVVVFAGRA